MKLVTAVFSLFLLTLVLSADVTLAKDVTSIGNVCDGPDCSACNIVDLANNLIKWLIGLIAVLFAVLMVIAGFGLVTSGGNPSALQSAKDKFTNAIIGFIIVLAAWLIVDTLMRTLLPGNTGNITGYGPWSRVQCWEQVEPDELPEADFQAIAPTAPTTVTVDGVSGVGADGLPVCEPSDPDFPDCGVNIVANNNMNPIFETNAANASNFNNVAATANMQRLLNGPFARLQSNFGRSITINDAIVKQGSSRETGRRGSQHFNGNALDLSTAGMSDADKIRLFREAKRAGFTGFGFGRNILHVDVGPKRAWDYGNSTYGGVSVAQLKAEARR